MAFHNRARLPFYVRRPQFPEERNVFRLANGQAKVQFSRVRKVYEAITDYLPEHIHEKLKIALAHDTVTIEGQQYLSGLGLVAEGDYEITWQEFRDYPLAQATFKVEVTPFNYTNDNCQTCEEASQLSLEDDSMTGPYESLEEGSTTQYNVFENDSICCSPVTAEIVYINSLYVDDASITNDGLLEVTLNAETPSATNAKLITYRVTCPNGNYDDADVYANISGSEESCLAPENLQSGAITTNESTLSWEAPPSAPDSYNYQLYLASDLFNPIKSSSTTNTFITFDDLTPGTCYKFFVQSVCEGGGTSEYVDEEFCTEGSSEGCGRYLIHYNDGTGNPGNFDFFYYMQCNGDTKVQKMQNMTQMYICALETSPGNPVQIVTASPFSFIYSYVEPC
jgi:hypothetical protein